MLRVTSTIEEKELSKQHKEITAKTKAKKAKAKQLTLEESWQKIATMKNSAPDKVKLRAVYEALNKGIVEREEQKLGKTLTKAEALRLYVQLVEITRHEKLEQLLTTKPKNYITIKTVRQFMEMWNYLILEPIIALDTETTGLNVWLDTIVGVSFTLPVTDKHYYIPIAHDDYTAEGEVMELLEDLLADYKGEVVFHNATFDLHILRNNGCPLNDEAKVHDTVVMMHLLNENEPSFKLKDLAPKYLKKPADNYEELFGKNCKFNTVPLKYAEVYATKDTHITYELYEFCKKYLKQVEVWEYYLRVEQPLIRVVASIESQGFTVDLVELKQQLNQTKKEINLLELRLKTTFFQDEDINLNSTKQLLTALNRIGIKVNSTKKEALEKYKDLEVVADLLEYKKLQKHLTGFLEKVESNIQKSTGKVHPSYNQAGTNSGRFSSQNPNFQQLPKPARKMYGTDEGNLLVSMDFSKQEVLILAHLSQDPSLLESIRTGHDIYSSLASKIFNKPLDECGDDSLYRTQAKTIVLGLLYGMGIGKLSADLGISKDEAKKLTADFFSQFTLVEPWMEDNLKFAKKNGYVKAIEGRKIRFPNINSRDWETRGKEERKAKANSIIQSSASVQTKVVMILLHKRCEELSSKGRKFALISTVHDELILSVPKDVKYHEMKELEEIMVTSFPLDVPVKTDIAVSFTTWGEMEDIDKVLFKGWKPWE